VKAAEDQIGVKIDTLLAERTRLVEAMDAVARLEQRAALNELTPSMNQELKRLRLDVGVMRAQFIVHLRESQRQVRQFGGRVNETALTQAVPVNKDGKIRHQVLPEPVFEKIKLALPLLERILGNRAVAAISD